MNISTGCSLTFSDIYNKSIQLSSVLHQFKFLKPKDVVLCVLNNNIYFPVILLGFSLNGILVTGASPNSTIEELNHFINKTGCKIILTENGKHLDWLTSKTEELDIKLILLDKEKKQKGINFFEFLESNKNIENRERNKFLEEFEANKFLGGTNRDDEDDPLFVALLSSSTSESAKVILLTHRNYINTTEILKPIFDKISNGKRGTTIAAQPFYHASGLWILCYCLLFGHRSLVMKEFEPIKYLNIVEENKIETLSLNPLMIASIVEQLEIDKEKFNLSSVQTIISGGWMDPTNASEKLINYCSSLKNFVNSYGMTEIVLVSHMTPLGMDKTDKRITKSVGRLLPEFEYKIVDCLSNEDLVSNKNYSPGTKGELWLRSASIMHGYLNDSILNKKAIDSDGWFHTGDIVYEDHDGFFFVLDRISNLIIVDGHQVWPTELEAILLLHPRVQEACVVGVKIKLNGNFVDAPKAIVVLSKIDKEQENEETISLILKEILLFTNERLERHQQITGGIMSVDSLPKTPFGKIARGKVRGMFLKD
uniref:Acetyl-CoA synthetase-like protein n=1 Tax=Meloidogyne floridensis TaxID=298350 RepID=A0A915NZP7_9BILA